MKYILLITLLLSNISAFEAQQRAVRSPNPVHPIVIHPDRPIIQPVAHQDNYYNTNYNNTYNNCQEIIDKKNIEIQKLKEKIKTLESNKAEKFQRELREKHEREMKAIDDKKDSKVSKNSIEVTEAY